MPVTTAVLGGEAQVPTITGSVRLKIPETTQSGQVFRLKGHGMPVVGKPDERGDLYATVDVQLPRSLTRAARALRGAGEIRSIVSESGIHAQTPYRSELELQARKWNRHESSTSTPRRPRKRSSPRSSSPIAKGIPRSMPEHLLLTLLEQKDGIVPAIVRKMNADPAALAAAVRAELNKLPRAHGGIAGRPLRAGCGR